MVASGAVRDEDIVCDDRADAAADVGKLRQNDTVINARDAAFRVRGRWYLVIFGFTHISGP